MPDRVLYAYAVVRASTDPSSCAPGIDGGTVESVENAELAALVSSVEREAYSPERVELMTEEVAWLGPRARAHDAVVTWAGDRGAVVPLPIFTLFNDESRVREMLRDRAGELQATLDRVGAGQEYGLRIFRIDDALAQHVSALSPRIEALERQARDANPGQRYLLERKLETERRNESRRIAGEVAGDTFETLAPLALEAVRDALPAKSRDDAAGVAVLNAFFLVRRDALEPFQRSLTTIVREHEAHGFRFDFTGPWPPYHFVGGSARASAAS